MFGDSDTSATSSATSISPPSRKMRQRNSKRSQSGMTGPGPSCSSFNIWMQHSTRWCSRKNCNLCPFASCVGSSAASACGWIWNASTSYFSSKQTGFSSSKTASSSPSTGSIYFLTSSLSSTKRQNSTAPSSNKLPRKSKEEPTSCQPACPMHSRNSFRILATPLSITSKGTALEIRSSSTK